MRLIEHGAARVGIGVQNGQQEIAMSPAHIDDVAGVRKIVMLHGALRGQRRNVAHGAAEAGPILGVRGVILINVHAEHLRHDGLARTPPQKLAPRLPMRGIGLGNQPVAHGARDIAAQQGADGGERILVRERFCKHPEAGQGAE